MVTEFESAAKFTKADAEQNTSLHDERAEDLEEENQKLHEKVISLNQKLNDVMEELDRVANAFHDAKNKCLVLFDTEKQGFFPFVHKCVWNLLSKHVSFANVSEVIAIVLDMVTIPYDRLPSTTTMRNMNNERTLVS